MHQAQVTRGEAGYAMAALLVAMALMAVMMSVAMPVWRHAAQREKEAELVWRGQQYDRALQLYRRKTGVPGAPNLDVLLQQKFLRKKYKDPITGGDFDLKPVSPLGPGSDTPGVPGTGNRRPGIGNPRSGAGGQGSGLGSQSGARPPGMGMQGSGQGSAGESVGGTPGGGRQPFGRTTQTGPSTGRTSNQSLIGGVRSRSKAPSIRELNGRNRYDQWEFVYVPYNPNPLPPGTGGTGPGQQPRRPGQQQRPGSSRPGSSPGGSQRPGASGSAFP